MSDYFSVWRMKVMLGQGTVEQDENDIMRVSSVGKRQSTAI